MLISPSSIQSPALMQQNQGLNNATQTKPSQPAGNKAGESAVLTEEQRLEIQKLKDRDREVRNHEQAHLSAAGGIAVSGASFTFAIGPDGQRYAVGGEVGIDTSTVPNNPEATLRKAETIRRAALAPAQPSAQDYNVASKAAAMARKASLEMLRSQLPPKTSGSNLDVKA
jgi:hypothetical protein